MRKKSNITVQEPPMQELKKKGSCAKQSCVSGCGCLVIILLLLLLFLRLFVLSYPKTADTVPQALAKEIPIYHQDSINKIKIVSGQRRANMVNNAAYIPKVLLSPILYIYELYASKTNEPNSKVSRKEAWNAFIIALNTDIIDSRDIIEIKWDDEKASPQFILDFYKRQLIKHNYQVESTKPLEITFTKNSISGYLVIKQKPNSQETDNIILTVSLPN